MGSLDQRYSLQTRVQDKLRPPQTDLNFPSPYPSIANYGQESSSSSQLTDGHWLSIPSVPEVKDLDLNHSLSPGNSWSRSWAVSASSLGGLACPHAVVSAPAPAEHFWDMRHTHAALSYDRSCANQALTRRGCQNTQVFEGLNLTPQFMSDAFLPESENTFPFVSDSGGTPCDVSVWGGPVNAIDPQHDPFSVVEPHGDSSSAAFIPTHEMALGTACTPLLEDDSIEVPATMSTGIINIREDSLLTSGGITCKWAPNSSSLLDFENPSESHALIRSPDTHQFTLHSESVGLAGGPLDGGGLEEYNHYSSPSQFSDSNTGVDEGLPFIPGMGKKWFCPCSGCEYTAGSKKDVCRHLCSRKHEKEPIGRLLRSLRNYKCIFPNCKSRSKTFSRRDNFKRHMADVHNVQLPQLNSGRPAKVSARSVLMGHGEE